MGAPIVLDARFTGVPSTEIHPQTTGITTRPLPSSTPPNGRLALKLADGGEVRLDHPVTIGQSRSNEIVLRDLSVSRHHCVIDVNARGCEVRDLESTNGTFVNGLRVSTAELRAGAIVELGSTRLRVAYAGADDSPLVGESPPMQRLRRDIGLLASSDLPVLVAGETGTGKELVALALHRQSGRAGAFVPVNCGSIPKELVESELFGHERGAFTGATLKRAGVFQEADGGTLFLDEIGELPPALQPRLLRALESGVVRPVGADRELPVDVRVIAATHVDLRAAVAAGRFREDLYYRLNGAILETPPLRARASDLRALVRHLLDELDGQSGRCRITERAMTALAAHPWPGNVRELKNVLRRAAVLGGPVIDERDLELRPPLGAGDESGEVVRIDNRPYLEIERDVLEKAIRRHRGNKRAAAHALRIPKSTLCDKARRYGISD
ncbi:MAG TPA: sigma 54-interacting transcriptional regulator [Polyangia bacterium]|nr:sigma 54-interacting transcriptional regulator [Polyangia bacterium]